MRVTGRTRREPPRGDAPAAAAPETTALPSLPVSRPTDPREQVASWVAAGGSLSNRAVSGVLRQQGRDAHPGFVAALGPAEALGAAGAERAQRLGVDPAAVRVHSGAPAARVATRLGADALTVGNHVAFGADRYRPDTAAGRRLLDHELVHVAQGAPGVHRTVSDEADELLHEAIEFHFTAADVEGVQAELDSGSDPGEEFWSELLGDPTARALHFRTAMILSEAAPADDDAVHELLESAMDVAADEAKTLAQIGAGWADKEAWAFPDTWAARVAGALQPPSGLELAAAADDRASAEKDLGEAAGRLPEYVYEHGLPVPFAEALQLAAYPFRPGLARLAGDHVVGDFAVAARRYIKAAVRSAIAAGWAAGKQRLVDEVADGMKVVTPASWAAVAAPRVYQPDLDQLVDMAAEQGVGVFEAMQAEQVDLQRYELALAKLAGLLSPLLVINAWVTATGWFGAAMGGADALVAKASAGERLDRADAWADERGYPAAAREMILKAFQDNAGEMVVDTVVDVGISLIPVIGWLWAAKEAVETVKDLYDAGVSLVEARERVGSATSVVALQRGAAQLSMAENSGAVTAVMAAVSAMPAKGRKPDADAPRGGPPAKSGDAPATTADGSPPVSGHPGGGSPGGSGRTPDLLDLQQASHLRSQAKEFDALATRHREQAELEDKRGRPDRAKAKRELADKAQREADDRRALADEYASGQRSARSELPGVEDFDDFFGATDETIGDVATSGELTRIALSAAERTPENLARVSRELMTSKHGGRVVYRVDGGKGRALLSVDSAGNVTVEPGRTIHLNFGSPERALEFLSKPTKGGTGGRLVRFEVSEEWVKSLRSGAAPEAAKLEGAPQLVDVKYADDQMSVPGELTGELEDFIVPGSGREVVVDDLKPVP